MTIMIALIVDYHYNPTLFIYIDVAVGLINLKCPHVILIINLLHGIHLLVVLGC